MTAPQRLHVPQRPRWLCRVCAEQWPCSTARTRLAAEYADDRPGLRIYLAGRLIDAIDDLTRLCPNPGPDPRTLFVRFMGWPTRTDTRQP